MYKRAEVLTPAAAASTEPYDAFYVGLPEVDGDVGGEDPDPCGGVGQVECPKDVTIRPDLDMNSTGTTHQLGHTGSINLRVIFIFDLSHIPTGSKITSASISLTEASAGHQISTTQVVQVRRLTDSGTTDSATWATKDGTTLWTSSGGTIAPTPLSETTVSSSVGDFTINNDDFKALVQDAVDNRSGELLLLFTTKEEFDGGTSGTERLKISSLDDSHVTNRPNFLYSYLPPQTSFKFYTSPTQTSREGVDIKNVPCGKIIPYTNYGIDSYGVDADAEFVGLRKK
jgi:hypothetical protein